MVKVIQQYYKTLSVISPKLAAHSAFEMFKKVRKKDIRDREKPFYLEAVHTNLHIDGEDIHTYEFGNPNHDVVVLVHGWDSNAGSMYKFIAPLLAKDKYVIGLNLPGHAFHKKSKTTLIEAKETFKRFTKYIPKNRNLTIISHSFGSAVVGYGLSEIDLKPDNLIFLTSPNRMTDVFRDYKEFIKLGDKSYEHLLKKTKKVLGESLEKISIANKMKSANFDSLYLFHDKHDKIIPYGNSEDIHNAFPNSTLRTFDKIGHYRMLWNEDLVNQVVAIS